MSYIDYCDALFQKTMEAVKFETDMRFIDGKVDRYLTMYILDVCSPLYEQLEWDKNYMQQSGMCPRDHYMQLYDIDLVNRFLDTKTPLSFNG